MENKKEQNSISQPIYGNKFKLTGIWKLRQNFSHYKKVQWEEIFVSNSLMGTVSKLNWNMDFNNHGKKLYVGWITTETSPLNASWHTVWPSIMCLICKEQITVHYVFNCWTKTLLPSVCVPISWTQYCTINDMSECHVSYTESLQSSYSKLLQLENIIHNHEMNSLQFTVISSKLD
jgi:hypothetical protein